MKPIFAEIQPGQRFLIVAPPALLRPVTLEISAWLAMRGPVEVLDGGNGFDAYRVARTLRRHTPDLAAALRRIRVARVFTCYQMAALLSRTPATQAPKLVMDVLATFYDENVALPECARLLSETIRHLHRLSLAAPLVVSAHPPAASQPDRSLLLARLEQITEKILVLEHPSPQRPLQWF